MKAALGAVLVTCAAAVCGGCGTVCNLAGGVLHPDREPRVYGGVQRDLEILDGAIGGPAPETQAVNDARAMAAILAVAAVDPVLCLVADTLTLPITIPLQAKREAALTGDEARDHR